MKLSISNIAWTHNEDEKVYKSMVKHGFSGLEIAPTRIFTEKPYDQLDSAKKWKTSIAQGYGFAISSMQSIWYGKADRIFGSDDERNNLRTYMKKAIMFAETIGCKNLVLGCPRNRIIPESVDPAIGVHFFRELGDFAYQHHTAIGMEANPPIYHTNYINTTSEALSLIRVVDSKGFKLNLDVGTMVENNEDIAVLDGSEELINHVHISEPGLAPIKKHLLHQELAAFLNSISYQGFVSIETSRMENLNDLNQMMEYVADVFT